MVDLEISFTLEEMKKISEAAELNKQTPKEYVEQVISNAYKKDLRRSAGRKANSRAH